MTTDQTSQNDGEAAAHAVQRKFIAELALYAGRMRLIFRAIALALVVFLFFREGPEVALGALMGALIVEINLSIFHWVVKKSDPAKKEGPIWLTILKFYALFVLTALYVFLCIFLKIGTPLGFLFGILSFLPALLSTFAWALASHLLASRGRPGKDDLEAEA
jgi:hypothetical protein